MSLSLADITATIKLLEKEKEKLELKTLSPGASSNNLTLDIDYNLVKGEPGTAFPQFKSGEFLVEAILVYAQSLDTNKKKPKESIAWLDSLFGDRGVMGTIIRADKSAPISNEIRKHFENEIEKCKLSFQKKNGKKPKEGNATVSGTVTLRLAAVAAKRTTRSK